VNGEVDKRNRALITILIRNKIDGQSHQVVAWIDTAFDGHLVFSQNLIDQLGLESLVETEAILADGSKVALETFICFVEWFGERVPVQVIANEGRFPLLGTELLAGRELSINYLTKELRLD
jgi:clan AA aspartic protease